MTQDQAFMEATLRTAGAILRNGTGRRKRRARRRAPLLTQAPAKALREAGLSEHDIQILTEGHERELAFVNGVEAPARTRAELPPRIDRALVQFQEAVDSTVTSSSASTLAAPDGWEQVSTGTLAHPSMPGHKLMVDGQNWRHHTPDGRIAKRGTGAASLSEYAKSIPGDWGGSQNASESLADVLNRVRRGGAPAIPPDLNLHKRLAEAATITRGTTHEPARDLTLHERLRRAATR